MNCNGKNVYDSEKEAKKARSRVYKQRSVKLRVYQCPDCHKWHLTKTTGIKWV